VSLGLQVQGRKDFKAKRVKRVQGIKKIKHSVQDWIRAAWHYLLKVRDNAQLPIQIPSWRGDIMVYGFGRI